MKPKVSVIMPSLNVCAYIKESIESVKNQTLKEIEIICVDAGSTDGTLEILQEYSSEDPRIKLIISDKRSYGYQMNLGLSAATGEYIGIVETDDFVAKNMYEVLYNIMLDNSLDVVKSNYKKFYSHGSEFTPYPVLNDDPTHLCKYNQVFNPIDFPGIFCIQPTTWTALYRTDFIRNNDIVYNETPGASYQDVGFSFQTLYCAQRVMVVDKYFHCYRLDNESSSSNSSAKVFCMSEEYNYIEDFLKKHPSNRSKVMPYLVRRKFSSYLWTYGRVSAEYQQAFYFRFVNEFEKYSQQGLINYSLYSDYLSKQLTWMLRDKDSYFRNTAKIYQNNSSIKWLETEIPLNTKPQIIVSLTSYPARINYVATSIRSLMEQTMKADMIVLWLAEEQFPNLEKDLPTQLLELKKQGLVIRWCDKDLKSHKKYYYAMLEYPDEIIITADDDLIYSPDSIETLYQSYLEFPNCVSALRCHLPIFTQDGRLENYKNWKMCYSELIGIPSMTLFATSGGGTLYPPKCMHSELFNIDAMLACCPYADDIWMKFMQLMSETPTVMVRPDQPLKYVADSQKEALWHTNLNDGGNDLQIANILERYNEYYGAEDTLLKRMQFGTICPLPKVKRPKVSIIMPIYNASEYLRESLDSACKQNIEDIEIICIDDGSTDDSLEILHAMSEQDPRIIILKQNNQGSGIARNNGLYRAGGEFISFLDADDKYPDESTLQNLYNLAKENNLEICGGSMSVLQLNGKIKDKFSGSIAGQAFSAEGIREYAEYQFEYGYQRFIYRRSMLRKNKINFPDYLRFQDPPFMVKAMICAGKFYHIPAPTYLYREGHKSVNWTERKVCDLIHGLIDLLDISSNHNFVKMHMSIVYRFCNDFNDIIMNNLKYPEVARLVLEANAHVNNALLGLNNGLVLKPAIALFQKDLLSVLEKEFIPSDENNARIAKSKLGGVKRLPSNNYDKAHIQNLENELKCIRRSVSFRIGRVITFTPRKIRGGIRCCREHGALYTVRRTGQKVISFIKK
ncbi:MAG: glycosyltransferase [Eubacteriales bacterium]|nr:glycosyltransferase [Eubacteriales bacterium]